MQAHSDPVLFVSVAGGWHGGIRCTQASAAGIAFSADHLVGKVIKIGGLIEGDVVDCGTPRSLIRRSGISSRMHPHRTSVGNFFQYPILPRYSFIPISLITSFPCGSFQY